jgi:hypothetical protein
MDISNRNDGESSEVFSNRHPEVIHWDNGEARIVEDMPDGDGVTDACEGGSALLTRFAPWWAPTVVVSSTDLP